MNQNPLIYLIITVLTFVLLIGFILIYQVAGEPTSIIDQSHIDYYLDRLADTGIEYTANPVDLQLLEHRKIVIATDVNAALAMRVIRSLLLLSELDTTTPIDIYIRTEGGWVSDAFAIIDIIQNIEAPVNTHAIGGTYSSGAMILASGTGTRYAYTHSSIMFHAGLSTDDEEYDNNSVDNTRLIAFWENHSNVPSEWIHTYSTKEIYNGPEEALTYGIVDQIRWNIADKVHNSINTK